MLTRLWVSHTASTWHPTICSVKWRKSHWNSRILPSEDCNKEKRLQYSLVKADLRYTETRQRPPKEIWWTQCCFHWRTPHTPAQSTRTLWHCVPGCAGGQCPWSCHTEVATLFLEAGFHSRAHCCLRECPCCWAACCWPPAGGRMCSPSSIPLPKQWSCQCSSWRWLRRQSILTLYSCSRYKILLTTVMLMIREETIVNLKS